MTRRRINDDAARVLGVLACSVVGVLGKFPKNIRVALFVLTDTPEGGATAYASNAPRESVVRAVEQWLAFIENEEKISEDAS